MDSRHSGNTEAEFNVGIMIETSRLVGKDQSCLVKREPGLNLSAPSLPSTQDARLNPA
jgi:hypothetical protein